MGKNKAMHVDAVLHRRLHGVEGVERRISPTVANKSFALLDVHLPAGVANLHAQVPGRRILGSMLGRVQAYVQRLLRLRRFADVLNLLGVTVQHFQHGQRLPALSLS